MSHGLQLRSLQMINWSHLPPTPLGIAPGVNAFLGANGSGKSSALDAIKAVLGAKRFGQNRSAASYIHRTPAGEAEEALILVVASGCQAIAGVDLVTLCLSVTRRNRRFLVIDEPVYLGLGERPIEEDLADLMREHPRGTWMNSDRWGREVLTPLGVTPTVVRLLELPQGEAGRIISSRQQDLLPQLLSMLGFDDRIGLLREERLRLQEARDRRDDARREVLAERRRAAGLEEASRTWHEWRSRHDELCAAQANLRAALTHELASLAASGDHDDDLSGQIATLETERRAVREALGAPAAGPPDIARHAHDLAATRRGSRVVADHITPIDDAAARRIAGLLGPRLWTVVCGSDAAFRDLVRTANARGIRAPIAQIPTTKAPDRRGLRAMAQASDPMVDAYLHMLGMDDANEEGAGAQLGREWFPPQAFAPASGADAGAGDAAERLARIEEARADLVARQAALTAARAAAESAREQAQAELEMLGEGTLGQADDAAAARAELRAAERALDRMPPRETLEAEAARYEAASRRIAHAEQILGEHDELVERLLDALGQAEDIWRDEVSGLLETLGGRFHELARAAGMDGELAFTRDGSGEWRIDILIAEHPGRPRKSYFRDGDLSGGWKAKVGLILMLAALTGGSGRFPLVILDEHAAALDEDRIAEIGAVMQMLASHDGLQFCLGLPTRRAHERLAWASQQIGFLAPAAGATHAPAPLMITAS